jgi:hypothetical protein
MSCWQGIAKQCPKSTATYLANTLSLIANNQLPLCAWIKRCSFKLSLNGGGAYRDRTDDPLLAKQVLSQLS